MARRGEKTCHTCQGTFSGDWDEHWCSDDCKIKSQHLDSETGKQHCGCCSALLDPSHLNYYEMELSYRLRTQEGYQNESRGRWLCSVCANTHVSSSVQYPRQWMGESHSADIAQAVAYVGSTLLEKLEQLGADDSKASCNVEGLVNVMLNFHNWIDAGEVHLDQVRETLGILERAVPQRIQNRVSFLTAEDAGQLDG